MMTFLKRLRSDEGYALPTVIVLSAVMLVLVTGSLSVTASGLTKANNDQDTNAALAAAYAGVAEYQSRLSNDSTYQKFGNPDAPFTKAATNPTSKVSLPTGPATNSAFAITPTGSWAVVPGSNDRATFRYEVDNSRYGITGIIKVRATGRVDGATRSVVADLRQTGFLDFLYFTNFETQDPAVTGASADCAAYDWVRPSNCVDIQFGSSDVIDGPVHTNDRLNVCGSRFKGTVSSAAVAPLVVTPSSCSAGRYDIDGTVLPKSGITIPATNSLLLKETRNDLVLSDVPDPGCLYTGPTVITLTSAGEMNIVSPWTQFTNIAATKSGASNPAKCGAIADLHRPTGATIDVLDKNLIFVQNVPKVASDANYATTVPGVPAGQPKFTCAAGTNPGWSLGSVGYPIAGESRPYTSSADAPAYGCENGDAFVSGVLKGALTIGSENYIYVTGDITYDSLDSSILGLIGQNAVWVYNPMRFTYQDNYNGTPGDNDNGNIRAATPLLSKNRTIQAAILSVAHTIMVQNYQWGGTRGNLNILGAMAQRFRGTVGTANGGGTLSNGFSKSYKYDERLRFAAPPKFLTPVSTTYAATQYANVAAAFSPTGVALNADGTPIP